MRPSATCAPSGTAAFPQKNTVSRTGGGHRHFGEGSARAAAARARQRLRPDHGQSPRGPHPADAPREASRRVHRRQHIRQPDPVRAEGGFRALSAHSASRCGNDERGGRGRRVRADRGRDLPGAADLRGRAFGPPAHPRGRVPARALPRRRHRGAEALQHGLSAHRDLRQEGLPAVRGAARHGEAARAPVEIIPAETVRAEDGLALSSRNAYLTPVERTEATRLYRILQEVRAALLAGRRDYSKLEAEALAKFNEKWAVDYVAVRRQSDLQPPSPSDRNLVVLCAAKLGRPRLIDNVEVSL